MTQRTADLKDVHYYLDTTKVSRQLVLTLHARTSQ
jgi:hypothetical protein